MIDAKKTTYIWPDNIVKEILHHEEFIQWLTKPPKNAGALLDYIIGTTLRDFECDILRRRYQDKQSLQTIGEAHSVTREWVRVALQKSIQRLQSFQKRELLLNGLDWKINKEMERAYQEGYRRGYRDSMGLSIDAVHNAFTMEHYLAGLPGYERDLTELGLSEQTYNLLMRAGIQSMDQLLHTSEKALHFVFRLSERARREIAKKLSLRGLRLREDASDVGDRPCPLEDADWWMFSVMERLLRPGDNETFNNEIPADFKETFLYVLQTILSEEERKVLCAHFRDVKSVDVISQELDMTKQNAAGYLGVALHKLRSDHVMSSLFLGIKGKIKSHLRMESERGYFDGFDAGIDRDTKSPLGVGGENGRRQLVLSIEKLPIEELQLNVRARHCLLRAGIETIGDLMRYTDNDLLQIHYLGYGTLNEIRDKQRAHYREMRTDIEISQMKDPPSVDSLAET